MAGNKVNTKTKGKDDKGKGNKQNNEDTEEPDFALLRKPILTSITGFSQARKIFDMATEELKSLLSNECDILYECKVCRNIFRSLANFISHKRVYCKEKFNSTVHGHFIKATSTICELMKIKQVEDEYQESMKEKHHAENIESVEVDERIPLTKDLTAIVEKITEKKGVHECLTEAPQMDLQKIPNSSVAVFQNVNTSEKKSFDNMRVQVKELENLLSRNVAVLQNDGNFKIQSAISPETGNVIQISDDEEIGDSDVLKCKTCDLQFSTQKTLKFHMKYKHVESRLVYPCTDCLEIFSTSWSVYRHLFKVHRKSAAQIRRLRESIQAKAFKMNNPPAFYEKRKNNMKSTAQKITEEERIDQENQAWMENMEGLGSVPRCGACGRAFERRAALAAHAHTCQPRARAHAPAPAPVPHPAPAPAPAPPPKRIEIQIRKDYNKGPPAPPPAPPAPPAPAHIDDEDDTSPPSPRGRDQLRRDEPMDVEDDDAVGADEKKTEAKSCLDAYELVVRLPHDRRAERSNIVALKQKIKSDVDVRTLVCKKCDTRRDNIRELYDHVAGHYGWLRYACKLCNFKNYDFDKLPEHVKVVHKLKGDNDFYFSTVKAIDGAEALELLESTDELNDTNEASPDSRRPSRCSSDSSRLSDDSSSSSTRIESGARKRKMYQSKVQSKRRKEATVKVGEDQKEDSQDKDIGQGDNESSTNIKMYEENSSDMDDVDERIAKKQIIENSLPVASRRPVRRRIKPKNEDFEYDLSNLLKMEAQGYRDSQSVTSSKSNPTKKKVNQEHLVNYDSINKDCCGALVTLSKRAVENSSAHMKTSQNFAIYNVQKEPKSSNIFVRPMLPKSFSRVEKISPKKDSTEDKKDTTSPNKETRNKALVEEISNDHKSTSKIETNVISTSTKEQNDLNNSNETINTNLSVPSVVPIKFRRQSLDLIKNPLINKNITDFTKAGMKTKILVIKPINRKKDGTSTNTPLKFQTIKLKDPSRNAFMKDNKSAEQVVVVKVPKVDCSIPRPESGSVSVEQSIIHTTINDNTIKNTEIPESKNDSNVHMHDDELLVTKGAETSKNIDKLKETDSVGIPENEERENSNKASEPTDSKDKSTEFLTNQPEKIETSLSCEK